jgi:putative Mn2+ efflux pump MntP
MRFGILAETPGAIVRALQSSGRRQRPEARATQDSCPESCYVWNANGKLSLGADRLTLDLAAATLLFGLAANTDNLTIGVAYGMRHRRIRSHQNLLIAIVTTLVTLVAMVLGRQIRELLPSRMPDMLGGGLLLAFAAWNFYRERSGLSDRPSVPTPRFAAQKSVGLGETLFLAATLSINNLGLAIAGGIGGLHFMSAAWSIFCFSVAMLALGQAAGRGFTEARSVPQLLRNPAAGSAVLALVGILMIAGY